MRSPREKAVWSVLAVILLAAAVAAWWTSDQWLPHAGPWAEHAWRKATRPGPDSLPADSKAKAARPASAAKAADPAQAAASEPPRPRKCVKDGRTTYTDEACPPGSQEYTVEGSVTSLPKAP